MSHSYVLLVAVLLSSVSEGRHHLQRHHVGPVRRQHVPLLHQVLPFLATNRLKHQAPKRSQHKPKVNSERFISYSSPTSRDNTSLSCTKSFPSWQLTDLNIKH